MTIKDKAKAFLAFQKLGDPRCKMLLMMLSVATGVPEHECQARIEKLAEVE